MIDVDWDEMTRDVEPPEDYKQREKGCFQKAAQLPVALVLAASLIIKSIFG